MSVPAAQTKQTGQITLKLDGLSPDTQATITAMNLNTQALVAESKKVQELMAGLKLLIQNTHGINQPSEGIRPRQNFDKPVETQRPGTKCNRPGCEATIYFLTSKNTGGKYPVDNPNDPTSFHSKTCRGQR